MADSVTGIVLDIPKEVLDNIKAADTAIRDLERTSNTAAGNIKRDFETTMVDGVNAFIKKVNEAQNKLGSLNINVNIKDSGFSSLSQTVSQSLGDVFRLVQQLSQIAPNANLASNGLGKISDEIKKAFPYEAGKNIDQLTTAIDNINKKLVDSKGGVSPRADEQYLVNLRARYQEELRILNQSDQKRQEIADKEAQRKQKELERNSEIGRKRNEQYHKDVEAEKMLDMQRRKAFDAYDAQERKRFEQQQQQAQRRKEQYHKEIENERLLNNARQKRVDQAGKSYDNTVLSEQNKLLNERLKIQKQLGNLAAVEAKNTILGNKPLTADQMGLKSDLLTRIGEIDKQLSVLGTKYDYLGEKARRAFDTRNVQGYLAWQQETIKNEENIAKARAKANELITAQGKAGLQPTTEELSVQRQLAALYTQKLGIEKEIQQVNNQITLQGRGANAAQQQYLTYLNNQTRALSGEISTVAQGYTKIEQAANNKYMAEWLHMQEKAAYDLAQAQEQVNKTRQRDDVTKKLSEYKALVAENERLAKAMRDYVKAAGSAPAVTDTSASAQAYRSMEAQWQANEARRRQISAQNITEIAEFERQVQMKANQDNVNAFIQAEAQKKAAALQRISEESAARKAAYDRYTSTYEGAVKYAVKDTRTDTYEKREIAIKKVEAAIKNLSATDSDYANKLQRLTTILNTLKNAQKAVTDEMNKKPAPTSADAFQAIAAAKAAKSLSEYQKALEKVKTVMSTMNVNDPQWAALNKEYLTLKNRIDEIRKKMGEFKATASGVGDIAGQLARTLAATFSVSAITGYINKMIQVRAQFELQQTALRAILQNKDEADRIFMQVQQLALQSPFSILQMTTFTKQLAAYRIESEKLVGTTKMLADVSAGLGVDMGRLILAYGQVKAANYLRATEVRQFTEAGLNIAGELANYFSELQGKMISVGDVMDMITKRMVRFEDVEEVFKRVTSAGGLFYDMQKKQSETLWGQLQRIKDAMSIMFNEIGKSNQGLISDFLTTIRALISNWRELAAIVKSAGMAMAGFFVTKTIRAFVAYWPVLIANVKTYASTIALAVKNMGNLRAAIAMLGSTGWGAIIAGAALLATAIYQAVTATSALQEELARVSEDSMTDMYDAIFKFKELADTAKDATKSYKERAEAMESLNRTYKDILPSEMLEIENIRKMSDGYKEATEAIREYYTEAAKKKAEETIRNDQEQAWNTLIQHAKDMAGYLKSGQPDLEELPTATLKGLIGKSMLELKKEIDDGTTDVNDAWVRFKQLFKQTSGLDIQDNFDTRGFRSLFGEFTLSYSDFYDDILDISERGRAAQDEFDAQYTDGFSQESKALIAEYDKRKEAVKNFYDALMNYASLQQKGELKNKSGNLTELGAQATREMDAAKASMNQLLGQLGETQIGWDGIKDATENNTDALLLFDNVQKTVMGGFLTNIQKTANDTSIQAWAQKAQRELQNMGLSDLQMDIISLAKESATANKMQISMLDKLKISAETNYTSAAKDAKALSEQAIDNISKIQATRIQLIALGRTASEAQAEAEAKHGNGSTEKELQAEAEWWEKLAKLYGDYEKKKDKSRQKDIWTPRLTLMQKVNKEYEKLLKYYSKEDAMAKIRSSYGDAVAEAFKGTQWADISKWGTFDAQATVDRLKKLAEVAGKDAKKKILEAAGTIEAEIEIKVKESEIQKAKDEIQKAFDNYELTKTLGNLGLNVDLTYMVGGQPMTLPQICKDIEDKLKVAKATDGQEELVKTYEDYLRKVADMENKAAVERLKSYNKYLAMMYSDRAKAMIESYTTMKNMERDFADYRAKLEKEASDPATSAQRRQEISQQISMLETQARSAIKGVKDDLDTSLNKLDWEAFKGSPVFTQMYSDLETLSKKGIDLLITKLTTMRDKLQAMDNVDYRAVREITKYIEKLNTQRIEVDSWKELNTAIKEANALRKEGNNMDKAQSELMSEQANFDAANAEIANLQTIINLKQQEGTEKSKIKNLSADQLKLYDLSEDELQKMLSDAKDIANTAQANMLKWSGVVATLQKGKKALDEQLKRIKLLHDDFGKVYDSSIDLADALGADTEIWGDFAKGVGDSIFQVIELTIQLKIMGIAANSALGVIGYIAIALQGVASLFASIFRAGDKRKEKQIQRLQYKVEDLQKAYEKLQTAIEEAYTFDDYNAGYNQSMRNLQEQRKAIQEQLALEKSKKKSDKGKIREYEDALDELKEKEKELREARYEAMGSVGESGVRTEAENFVSAWLDAYKETGDGLDALKEHWDEFFQNLVLKQAASAIVSRRMAKYIEQINAAIDSGSTGLSLAQTFQQIGENLKSELGVWNEDLKAFFDAVGIKGGQGELLLSDLQKGIQNITEPQAAAIEAYLNSMRFAVFEQNNILTDMLTAIQSQYGTSADNPILSEVKAIRSLVASIDDRLGKVIVSRNSGANNYIMKVG